MRFCYSFVLPGLFAAATAEEGVVLPANIASAVAFKTIKAVNSATTDKDSWNIMGEMAVDERVTFQNVVDCGVMLELSDENDILEDVTLDCEIRGKNASVVCSTDGGSF